MNNQELNDLVIKTFGFKIHSIDNHGHWVYLEDDQDATLFKPADNIRDAWIIIDELLKTNPTIALDVTKKNSWVRVFPHVEAKERTMPIAICVAALKTKGVEVDGTIDS